MSTFGLIIGSLVGVLYIAFFGASLVLARQRKEVGFRVLRVAAGIWLLNQVLWWFPSSIGIRLSGLLYPAGLAVATVALCLLIPKQRRPSSGRREYRRAERS